MATQYEPFDGDYISDADYSKFLDDIQTEQGIDIGAHLEICVTLTRDDFIRIACSNDEGSEWTFVYKFPIPTSWDVEIVRDMFEGNVYLKTDDYQAPEDTGDDPEVDPYTQFCDDMANNPDDDLNIASK